MSVWNGNISNDWNTAGNWTPSGVPTGSAQFGNGTGATNNPCSLNGTSPSAISSLDMTGYAGTFTFNAVLTVSGNVTLSSSATYIVTGSLLLIQGTATCNLTSNGKTLGDIGVKNTTSASLSLQDDLVCGQLQMASSGALTTNNHTVTCNNVLISGGVAGTINLGSSTINLNNTSGTVWNVTNPPTMNAGTSIININSSSSSDRTFTGAGKIYNILSYTLSGSTGGLIFSDGNTFNTINFFDASNARTLTFTDATTTTITGTGGFNVKGTSGKLMTIANSSTTAGHSHTLTSTSGPMTCDYLSISHSTATPSTLTWYAGSHSTDGGSNSGWIFSTGPGIGNSQLMLMGVGS